MDSAKREVEVEYNKNLTIDINKQIKLYRQKLRQDVQKLLQDKIPHLVESTLTKDESRLLRLSKISPRSLNTDEQMKIKEINERMKKLTVGELCYNLPKPREDQLRYNKDLLLLDIDGVFFKMCISVLESFRNRSVNESLGFADVFIHIDHEVYKYPLDSEEFEAFMGHAYATGLDVENRKLYPPMDIDSMRDLEMANDNLRQLKIGKDAYYNV